MSIDLYSTREMSQVMAELKPPRMLLKNLFFATERTFTQEYVDVDIVRATRRLAPFVSPVGKGELIDRLGVETQTYRPPLVAIKSNITVPDMQTRVPGEHSYQGLDPNERAARLLGQDLERLDADIARREEWMCARALLDSKVEARGEDVSLDITFPRHSSLALGTLAASSRWTHADAEIIQDVRMWRRRVVKVSGVSPDVLILGEEAADALLKHPKLVQGTNSYLHTTRADLGQIAPELLDANATYIGSFRGTKIDIWGYDEWYVDPTDGVEKPFVPPKMALLGSTRTRTEMRYGAVGVKTGEGQSASITLVAAKRVPQSWVENEPPVFQLKLSSRPLPVPIQNNAFLTAQVVA